MVPPLQYERIKNHIRAGIQSGMWTPGARIPSENELAQRFSMSRMTANRAIKELTSEGLLERVQGKGTFVASSNPLQSVLRIHGINHEVRSRGSEYSSRVLLLESSIPPAAIAALFGIQPSAAIYHSRIVHLSDGLPIQLEERWVNPKIAPLYLEQNYTETTPHDYLMSIAPLTRGEHTIEACLPEHRVAQVLKIRRDEPCLLLYRQTWVNENVASYARLYHPGARYQLRADWS